MAMHVVAMIHHEGNAYGVSFPDFPGCTTVAGDLDSAVAKAGEALAFHAEGLAEDGPLPRPRSLSELQNDAEFLKDSQGAMLVLVPYEPPTRAVRINMTVEESLLARIDRAAEAVGETRSRYFATAARLRMGKIGEGSISKSGPSYSSAKKEIAEAFEPNRFVGLWKGYLKLSLVSCAISLYPAYSGVERISLLPINRKTGRLLRRQFVDAETGEPVNREDIGRGYEMAKGQYLRVDDELEKIRIESTRTIELTDFVPRSEIDIRHVDNTYYVAPDDQVGQEAFAVIREAMFRKDMAGIGSVVLRDRERPVALEPFGKGLRAMMLRYPYEVRSEVEFFANILDVHVSNEMRKLAEHIVECKVTTFDTSRFKDQYELALHEMLKLKQQGLPAKPTPQPVAPDTVINLMDALRRSISEGRKQLEPERLSNPRRTSPRSKT